MISHLQDQKEAAPRRQKREGAVTPCPEVSWRRSDLVWMALSFLSLLILHTAAILVIPPFMDEVGHLYIASDIAQLKRFPIYYYGQQYMGPLESYFLAPFVGLFGVSLSTARFAFQFFYLALLALYVQTIRRLFGSEAGRDSLILLCFLPFSALYFTTVIGFGEVLTLAVLSLVLLIRASRRLEAAPWWLLVMGVVSGLALWCNPVFVIWIPSLVLGCMVMMRGCGRPGLWVWPVAGLVAGLLPVWIHGVTEGRLMELQARGNNFSDPEDVVRLLYLFFARMKYFFSTFVFDRGSRAVSEMVRYLSYLPLFLFALSYLGAAYSFGRSWHRQTIPHKIFFLFSVLPPVFLALLYCTRDLIDDEGMRFFLPLILPYSFCIAYWISGVRSSRWRITLLSLLACFFLWTNLVALPVEWRLRREYHEIIEVLKQKGLRYGLADMKIAYGLNVLSGNRIVASPVPALARYRPLLSQMREEGPQFYLMDRNDKALRDKLEQDPSLARFSFGNYDLFYGASPLLKTIADTPEGPI